MCRSVSAVSCEKKKFDPSAETWLISNAKYTVLRDVARYGRTPASPMMSASLGTSLSAKVSLIVIYRQECQHVPEA